MKSTTDKSGKLSSKSSINKVTANHIASNAIKDDNNKELAEWLKVGGSKKISKDQLSVLLKTAIYEKNIDAGKMII